MTFLPPALVASQFDTQQQKAFEFVQDTTKQVITLSTAILSLTITFADKLERGRWDGLLNSAWALYVLAIICGIWVLLALAGTLEQIKTSVLLPSGTLAQTNVPVSTRGSNVTLPSLIQLGAFIAATILIVTYAVFAPRKVVVPSEKDKLVSEIRNQTIQLAAIVQKLGISDQSIKNLQTDALIALQELRKEASHYLESFNQQMKIDIDMREAHYKFLVDAINEAAKAIDKLHTAVEDKNQP